MSDVFQDDPNRIYISHATGDLQAWKPVGGDTSISMGFSASIAHKGDTQAWVNFTQFMSAQEARSLADGLLRAADHIESLLRNDAPAPVEATEEQAERSEDAPCQGCLRDGECMLADKDCPNPTKGDPSNCPLRRRDSDDAEFGCAP